MPEEVHGSATEFPGNPGNLGKLRKWRSHFGKVPGKWKEVIPEAQKVSGHMREGQRKPREVPGKSREVPGKTREVPQKSQGSSRKSSLIPRKC
jgi:hypothetical protein